MSTSTTINIFIKYVNDRFYNKIPYRNSNIIVLYNSFVYDVMAVIPFDHWEAIDEVRPFSDFIVLVSDATAKVEFPDQSIGIIYIDSTAKTTDEAISISRLPGVLVTDREHKKSLMQEVLGNVYVPFWTNYIQYRQKTGDNKPKEFIDSQQSPKNLTTAKSILEKAIQSYCSQNNVGRDAIPSYSMFVDHIAPDVFKNKMTVDDEMKLREEAKSLDQNNSNYPDLLVKTVVKLGLVA